MDKARGRVLVVNKGFALWLHTEGESPLYADDSVSSDVLDYMFFCFEGEPSFAYLSQGMDSHATARVNFVDVNWCLAPFGRTDYLPFEELPPKPATFDEMTGLAKKLSFGTPFVRVDLIEYCGRPRFSEMTFHNCSGYMPCDPPEWDEKVGDIPTLSR